MLCAEEWDLIKRLGDFPAVTAKAADTLDPGIMTGYLYDVCRLFSRFYQQCPILAECTLTVLKSAMNLVLVPYLEKM